MSLELLPSTISLPVPRFPAIAKQQAGLELQVTPIDMDDVQSRAQASLRASAYREVRETTCLFNNGLILLQGRVSSYYLKQMAQTLLMNTPGVRHIVNTIQVVIPTRLA
jgi:osmotically-inducible protein OsmY